MTVLAYAFVRLFLSCYAGYVLTSLRMEKQKWCLLKKNYNNWAISLIIIC